MGFVENRKSARRDSPNAIVANRAVLSYILAAIEDFGGRPGVREGCGGGVQGEGPRADSVNNLGGGFAKHLSAHADIAVADASLFRGTLDGESSLSFSSFGDARMTDSRAIVLCGRCPLCCISVRPAYWIWRQVKRHCRFIG